MVPTLKTLLIGTITTLFCATVQAQYLDYSQPARAKALGGNLVAMPEGPSASAFNPAGLALQDRFEASARYESLFPGLENDSLTTGNLTFLSPVDAFGSMGAFGLSWDHMGGNLLSQDRFILDWGKGFELEGPLNQVAGGLSLAYLTQRYTLLTPLTGVSTNQLSSSAFSLGAGVLATFFSRVTVAASAQDINSPNMGVIGIDRLPVLFRWGAAGTVYSGPAVKVVLTAAQSYSDPVLTSMGGMELSFPQWGIKLRGGADQYQGAVGAGYEISDFFLDYAYSFSIAGVQQVANAAPPGSHLFELGLKWGGSSPVAAYAQLLKRAKEAETKGQWETASVSYQECMSIRPTKEATEGRARTLAKFNKERAAKYYSDGQNARNSSLFMDARSDFELAAKLEPDNADYRKALAQAEREAAQAQSDQDVAATLRKVSGLVDRDDTDGAMREVDAALKRHPHNAALELMRDSLQSEPEPAPVAAAPATTQAQVAKEDAKVKAKLATTEADLLISHGQTDLAKQNLKEALKAQPRNIEIKKKLARLEAPTPVVTEANRQKGQELYEKGLMEYLQGNLTMAITDWEEALKADPTNTRVQNNLVRAKIEEKMEHQ